MEINKNEDESLKEEFGDTKGEMTIRKVWILLLFFSLNTNHGTSVY